MSKFNLIELFNRSKQIVTAEKQGNSGYYILPTLDAKNLINYNLSQYLTSYQTSSLINSSVSSFIPSSIFYTEFNKKVDKVTGKQLTDENFSSELKAKLEQLSNITFYDISTIAYDYQITSGVIGRYAFNVDVMNGQYQHIILPENSIMLNGSFDENTLSGNMPIGLPVLDSEHPKLTLYVESGKRNSLNSYDPVSLYIGNGYPLASTPDIKYGFQIPLVYEFIFDGSKTILSIDASLKSYIDTIVSDTFSKINTEISAAINLENIYTKTEVNNLFTTVDNEKANKVDIYTKAEVDNKVSRLFKLKGSVQDVNSLPSGNNDIGDVYLVKDDNSEYVWIQDYQWERLGVVIDLSDYVTHFELNTAFNTKLDTDIYNEFVESLYNNSSLSSITGISKSVINDYVYNITTPKNDHTVLANNLNYLTSDDQVAVFRTLLVDDLPAIPWSKIANKPTTLSGYQIADNLKLMSYDQTVINNQISITLTDTTIKLYSPISIIDENGIDISAGADIVIRWSTEALIISVMNRNNKTLKVNILCN